ncbi:MAG: 4Fe-4S dicluster domain-containing protein [Clostridia bacterium]|nr:4Fe-4S dicluster domain-containing protein [Clostridia bacterium]
MEYRQLGKTGIEVSRICFGGLTLGPLCANLRLEQGRDLLLAAFALGVNFIDAAQQYRIYDYIGAALAASDKRIVIATKTYATSDQEAAYALEEARLAFRRNKLDIFLLHEVRSEKDFASRAEAWRLLRDAKARGIIHSLGISTHSAEVAAMAARHPHIEVIHPLINIAGIGIRDGGREEMLAAISEAKKRGKGIYGMKALGGGALMRQAKESLQWAFAQDDLDSIAIGFKDEAELKTNIGWLEGREPREAARVRMLERKLATDHDPGCRSCGLCVQRCPQGSLSLDQHGQVVWNNQDCIYCGYCIAACPCFCLTFY